jgi:hypothetical protein
MACWANHLIEVGYQTVTIKDDAELFVDACEAAITPELDAEFMQSLGVVWP